MRLALILAAALSLPAQAADTSIEGVYKVRFKSGYVVPGQPDAVIAAEDVLELVRVDDSHLYVRAALRFYNGHTCSFHGVAAAENGAFVYRNADVGLFPDRPCVLTVSAAAGKLHLTDRPTPDSASTCSALCGARGSLGNYSIALSKKAPIRYLPRLTASREYKEAIAEMAKAPH